MPRQSIKTASKARSYGRRRAKASKKLVTRRRNASLVVRQPGIGFAPSQIVTMKYVDRIDLDSVASAPAFYKFRCNSIYDPDYSGVGGQPMLHDQMSTLYKRYMVLSAKCTVTFISRNTTANTSTAVVAIGIDDDTTNPTSALQAMEQPNYSWRYLGTTDGHSGRCTVSKNFLAKREFGVTDLDDNSNCGAVFGSNPARERLFTIMMAPVTSFDELAAMYGIVTITYTVLCRDTRELPQS